jgi:hypothetical protein
MQHASWHTPCNVHQACNMPAGIMPAGILVPTAAQFNATGTPTRSLTSVLVCVCARARASECLHEDRISVGAVLATGERILYCPRLRKLRWRSRTGYSQLLTGRCYLGALWGYCGGTESEVCGGPDLVAAQKARQVVCAAVLQPQRARESPPEQRWPSAAMAAPIPGYCAALVCLFVCLFAR